MSSLRSAVASVLRLVAVGLLLLGIVLLVLAYAAGRQGDPGAWLWMGGGLGVVLGLLLMIFSSALARGLTQDYE